MLKIFKFIAQIIIFMLFLGLAGYVLLPVALKFYLESKSGTAIDSITVTPKKLVLENINFEQDQTKIKIENITVRFSLRGLKNNKVKAVQVKGIDGIISLDADTKGSTINWQIWKEKLRWGSIPIEIKDAKLVVDHPDVGQFPLSFEGKGDLADVKGQLEGHADIDFVFQENQYAKEVSGKFSFETVYPRGISGSLNARHLKFLETPAPLNGQLIFQYDLKPQSPVIFKGSLLTSQDKPLLSITGEHIFPDSGFAEIKSEALRFGPKNLKLADYWKDLPKKLKHISGMVSAQGTVSWQAGKITQALDLTIANGTAEFYRTKISGLRTQLKFVNLMPIQTAPHQRVFIEKIESAIPLEQVQYEVTIGPKQGTYIHQVSAQIGSGKLHASNIKLDPQPFSQTIDVILERIPLDQIIQLMNINGLTASGKLSGTLPIIWQSNHSLGIKRTELVAQNKGHISYRSPNGSPKGNTALKFTATLFQDFQYDSLRLLLEKPAKGDLSASLDILGKNPKVQKGRPVHLKLNVSGDLMSLLETTWMSLAWDLEGLRLKSIQQQRKGQ